MTKLAKHAMILAALFAAATCGGGGGGKPTLPPGGHDTAGSDPGSGSTTTSAPAIPATTAKAVYAPDLQPSPLPGDPTKTTIHRLSNGMTVYITPDRQEPTIVAHVAVRSGGGNDPRQSTGLAHYLEHMLFKGTSKLGTLDYGKEKPHLDKIAALYADLRKPGVDRAKTLAEIDKENLASAEFAVPNELDQLYARMGITGLNAFTNNDATVYVSEIPKNRVAQWAKVEVARYSDPVFRLFWPELEAVYEEKNRGMDNPGRQVHEAFMKNMFPNHGYGWSSVLGEIEHLKSPAYQDMVAFFDRYYTPGNMAILLSGDVDTSVLPLLEKEFGQFKRPAGDATPPGAPPKLNGRQVVEVKVPADEGIVMGWPTVPASHADRLALDLMDQLLLDNTHGGMLARDLLLTQKVADAGASPTFLREAGFYQMTADALDGQSHADLEKLLLGLVDKLQKGDFTDTDLATAILSYEISAQQTIESNQGRMSRIEESFIDGVPWTDEVSRLDRMKKLTKADIMRVAKQYLTKDVLIIKKVKGKPESVKIEKPGITPVKLDPSRRSAFAASILDMPVTPIEPVALAEGKDYERGKLATGELITVKNEKNGLFALSFSYDYGRVDDRMACLALDVLKVSGAGKRNSEQVSRALHEIGITVDTGCSGDRSSITVSGIDRNLEQGMTLLREWLADPVIGDDTVKAYVAQALTERANSVATPNVISSALQQYARVGNDSAFLLVPSNKDLQKVQPAQVKKLLAKLLDMKHRTSYFGPRGKDAAAAIVLGKGTGAARAQRPYKFRTPGNVYAVDQDTKQMQIMMTWPRKASTDADRAAGMMFSEYAAAILYQEVREAKGLAYTVSGWYDPGQRKIDDASVGTYIGTQADKIHDSIAAIQETLAKPLDDKRLDTAREAIAQNHRVDRVAPRAIAFTVYAWQDQGEKADPRDARVKRTLALTKADLEKWIKDALGRKIVVSVSGPKKVIDEKKLSKLAPITWVPKEKLFGY